MKSIITRYQGKTDYRVSSIAACAEGVPRLYLRYDKTLSNQDNHAAAANALAEKHEWLSPGLTLVGGELPNGRGPAYVFMTAITDNRSVIFNRNQITKEN